MCPRAKRIPQSILIVRETFNLFETVSPWLRGKQNLLRRRPRTWVAKPPVDLSCLTRSYTCSTRMCSCFLSPYLSTPAILFLVTTTLLLVIFVNTCRFLSCVTTILWFLCSMTHNSFSYSFRLFLNDERVETLKHFYSSN